LLKTNKKHNIGLKTFKALITCSYLRVPNISIQKSGKFMCSTHWLCELSKLSGTV